MLLLALQGSPQKKGAADFLLSTFVNEAEKLGAQVNLINVNEKKIKSCQGCAVCEEKGFCYIDDDMNEIYSLLRQADVIVMATPIFFYSVTAQLKALIDRSQALWARKYKLKLKDSGEKCRQGFLLALGATKGENLFEGVTLTAKYFFDGIGASYKGNLVYRQIETRENIEKHPTVIQDVKQAVHTLLKPFIEKPFIV